MFNDIINVIERLDDKTIESFIEARKEMLKPDIENRDSIGINNTGVFRISRTKSATNNFLVNQKITLEGDILDYRYQEVGNIDDAYHSLISKIQKESTKDLDSICELVYETVTEYFGYGYNEKERLEVFQTLDFVPSVPITEAKGKNIAMCSERAILSHNLLKLIGINSTLKTSPVISDGRKDCHFYNLIENDGEHYIFDATIPRIKEGRITPLITTISNEAYNQMVTGDYDDGYAIDVIYNTPRRTNIHTFTYDSERKNKEKYDYSEEIKER